MWTDRRISMIRSITLLTLFIQVILIEAPISSLDSASSSRSATVATKEHSPLREPKDKGATISKQSTTTQRVPPVTTTAPAPKPEIPRQVVSDFDEKEEKEDQEMEVYEWVSSARKDVFPGFTVS